MGGAPTYASCEALLAAKPASPSDVYTLDPDGAGTSLPYQAFCEMVADGGGWTLAPRSRPLSVWQNLNLKAAVGRAITIACACAAFFVVAALVDRAAPPYLPVLSPKHAYIDAR